MRRAWTGVYGAVAGPSVGIAAGLAADDKEVLVMRSSAALVLVSGLGLVGCAVGGGGAGAGGTEEAAQALVMLDGGCARRASRS